MPTSFEEKVWAVIRTIPAGGVMSYREVADRLGTRAYRAVGRACGNSPGMPDVPCHRVIGSDGLLRGFNGGLEKKRALLEAEGISLKPTGGRAADYRVIGTGLPSSSSRFAAARAAVGTTASSRSSKVMHS